MLERVFAGLHWSTVCIEALAEAPGRVPGAWAAVLCVESDDSTAFEHLQELHRISPETVICVLVEEFFPDFDRLLKTSGVDAVIAKPVQEAEIVEALVSGFTARRSLRRG